MYLSINEKRIAVKRAYPGAFWSKRVSEMSEKQIAALYLRLMHAGKLEGRKP